MTITSAMLMPALNVECTHTLQLGVPEMFEACRGPARRARIQYLIPARYVKSQMERVVAGHMEGDDE